MKTPTESRTQKNQGALNLTKAQILPDELFYIMRNLHYAAVELFAYPY